MLFSLWYTEQLPDKVDNQFLMHLAFKRLHVVPFKAAKVIFPWMLSSPPLLPDIPLCLVYASEPLPVPA